MQLLPYNEVLACLISLESARLSGLEMVSVGQMLLSTSEFMRSRSVWRLISETTINKGTCVEATSCINHQINIFAI